MDPDLAKVLGLVVITLSLGLPIYIISEGYAWTGGTLLIANMMMVLALNHKKS